ncbi:MAG: metallophosphoesterase [Planctomycetota bacterium]|jgi:hypothetical protein
MLSPRPSRRKKGARKKGPRSSRTGERPSALRKTGEKIPAPKKDSEIEGPKSGRFRKSSKLAKTKSLMKKAARLNLEDPFRKGAVIELPAVGEALFTGDLHGHKDNLSRIIEIADLETFLDRHLVIQEIVHNIQFGLIDRDISFRVLERVAQLKIDFPERVHIMLGNHELSELTGKKIIKENHMLNKMFAEGIKSTYTEAAREIKLAYNTFFKSLPLGLRTPNGIFFSHSTPPLKHLKGFDPRVFRIEGEVTEKRMNNHIERLVWGRDFSQEAADAFAEMVGAEILIVGHEACSKGFKVPNTRHIILDCKDAAGCYVLVPLAVPITHSEVVRRIRRVNPTGSATDRIE